MKIKADSRATPPWHLSQEPLAGLGARILARRRQIQLSQQELARRTGLRREHLSRVENGHTIPTLREACALSRALGIGLDALVTGAPLEPLRTVEQLLSQLAEISDLGWDRLVPGEAQAAHRIAAEALGQNPFVQRVAHLVRLGLAAEGQGTNDPGDRA